MTDTATAAEPSTKPSAARWLGAIGTAAAAALVCAALVLLAYSFYETYGPNADEQFFSSRVLAELMSNALPFVIVAAVVVAGAGAAIMALLGRPLRARVILPLGVLSVLLTIASTVAGAWWGTSVKQSGQDSSATACTPDERTALESLGTPADDGRVGHGLADGSCRGFLAFGGDTDSGLAALHARLTAGGWRPAPDQGGLGTTYTRNGKTLIVTVVQDKVTEVTFSFP